MFQATNRARVKTLRASRRAHTVKKSPNRLRIYSFVGTLLVISLLIGVSYYQTLPQVEHIPDNFEFTSQPWMSYVPSHVEYVGYVNYAQAFFVTGNTSLFGSGTAIDLSELGFKITLSDVNYELEIQLPEPKYSGSATIIQVTSDKQSELLHDLASSNITKTRAPSNYDGYSVYQLLMRKFGDQTANLGFLTIVGNDIILSNDKNSGLLNVRAILDQISSKAPDLFDNATVRRSVYASGITDQNYAALFVGLFPTQLNDTQMAAKSVTASGSIMTVTRSLLFPSSDVALERWDQAHQVYKNAAGYKILDTWLVVTYSYPLTRMQAELLGL